jgi:hypothetical protein
VCVLVVSNTSYAVRHLCTQANLRMLIFSGDVDGIVPVVGTRRWVAALRLKARLDSLASTTA